jgi:hypothetical protein
MFRDLEIWLNHFEYHALHPRCVPAGLSDALKGEERRMIARSIAIFQLCEQPEGTSLLRSARRFAEKHNAMPLTRVTELFVNEQQRHATLLRAFMEDHDIARKQTDLTDFVFCCLRRIGRFETRLHVMVAAELIANVYYRALESATGCQRLKVLCRTLVADELAHIGLESQLLLTLRAQRPAAVRASARLLHKTFITCAASAVYLTHRAVLRGAGYNISRFLRVCRTQYAFYMEHPPAPTHVRSREPPITCRESSPRLSPRP